MQDEDHKILIKDELQVKTEIDEEQEEYFENYEDNNVNVLDIIITVANVLGYTDFSTDQFLAADMNMDGNVDVFDIMLIVDAALYAE